MSPSHPRHDLLDPPPRQREMKGTLNSFSYGRVISASLSLPPEDTKSIIKKLHTSIVKSTLNTLKPNVLLNGRPPPISEKEKKLPHFVRRRLSQIRSGYCNLLNSYKNKIDPNIQHICPDCGSTPHDVIHLFNCATWPVQIQPVHLWTDPEKAATELRLYRN